MAEIIQFPVHRLKVPLAKYYRMWDSRFRNMPSPELLSTLQEYMVERETNETPAFMAKGIALFEAVSRRTPDDNLRAQTLTHADALKGRLKGSM